MDKEITNVQRELYFLIAKFLKSGPCQEAAKVLQNELEQHQLVQKRLDWEGDEHDQSFSDMEKKYLHIGPRHLEEICCRLGPLLDKEIKPTIPGLKSLLGAGRQSLLRNKDSEKRFFGLTHFAVRRNGISLYSPNTVTNHNVVRAIVAQSISGPASRRHLVTPKMYSRVRLLNRILGHLSAVYCLLFDKTGRYIVTGADDLLVKVWSAVDGRLLNSFRGTSAEITDIDISLDNTLLAAGSLDKSIRVWNLQSGYPVATLSSHTGAITGVNFWPNSIDGSSYMVSTSSDGSVAFWSYTDIDGQSVFESKPIQYHEKLRPGQSQMLCARFSPGGMFLATGSADHHVRVYKMDREVPYRILEIEKHSDRVDSIQWANRGLKFVSGSKDGTAVLWQYQSQRWTIRHLLMSTTLSGTKGENEDNKTKLKVTMVCWSADDSYLITSVNDNTIKIWNPINGKLLNILKIHKDEVYVLENHPDNPRVMLSAGHDGAVHLWDIVTGEILSSYQNHIEGQGNGAVFDAKWSPDSTMIAATDAHGHILIFGIAPLSERMKDVPTELFFHTDYRPLIRDGITDQVIDEQTQVPPHLMPPPFLVDIEGTPYPPTFQRLVPGRENCTNDQLIPNIVFTPGGQQEVVEGVAGEARSNIDQMIRALAGLSSNDAHSTVSPRSRPRGGEGVRQSSGNWHRDGLDCQDRVIVAHLSHGAKEMSRKRVEYIGRLELEEYDRESRRVPETVQEVSTAPVSSKKQHRRHAPVYRTRAVRDQQLRDQVNEVPNEEPEYDQESSSNHGDSSDVNSNDMSSESSTDSSSTEYSDWVADHGVNLEPPKRSRQRRTKKPPPSAPRPPVKKTAPVNINAPSCSTAPVPPLPPPEIPDSFKPSEWLSEVIPKKFPYYPQMGDEVMFFAQGYELYLKAVMMKRFYVLAESQYKPWGKLMLNEPELVKIIGIKYELRPPRLCCLRLAIMRPNGKLTSDRFTIKYHDIPDVIDFFVLKQTYDLAMERQWKVGDKFRSMIDDGWWWGTIESRTKSNSKFLGYRIKWDNGESEAMSPWDMEPIDYSREPEVEGGSVPVLPEEIAAILYHPRGDEWPGGDRESACQRILAGLEEIMGLAVAEPFNAPVDTNVYPTYSYIVEFPIDLSTVKARFENRFYRRVTAAQFDIRYLATNTEKFNESHSSIVKQARIVTDLCLRLCKDYNVLDVPLLYRQLLETYHSSASEPEEPKPSTSKELPRKERAAANRSLRAMNRAHQQQPDWRRDCLQLLDVLFNCQDSEPFREPVDRLEHPDYDKVIDTPMDLGTAREELLGGNYTNPLEFCKDMRMIFSNSRNYNTNKRSKIYVMTVRLSAMAEEHMKRIISNWKSSLRRQIRESQGGGKSRRKPPPRRKKKKPNSDNDSTTASEDGDSDYNTKKPARHKGRKKKPTPDTYDKNLHGESSGLRSRTVPPAKRGASTSSDTNSEEESNAMVIVNGTSSSSEGEGTSSKAHSQTTRKNKINEDKAFKPQTVNFKQLTAATVGKRRIVASSNISYKERNDSSSSSSDDGPTKNWTMNGHIRVLRPVRRVVQNTVVHETKSSEEVSESSDEEDDLQSNDPDVGGKSSRPVRQSRPVRRVVQNTVVDETKSSEEISESSDEEDDLQSNDPDVGGKSSRPVRQSRPVRRVVQNTVVDETKSSEDVSESSDEEDDLQSNDPDVGGKSSRPVRQSRPVRRVVQNTVVHETKSSEEVSEGSDEEDDLQSNILGVGGKSSKAVRQSRPVRRVVQNTVVNETKSSEEVSESSDEQVDLRSNVSDIGGKSSRPVRQSAQNHSYKLAKTTDEDSSEEAAHMSGTVSRKVQNVSGMSTRQARGVSQGYAVSVVNNSDSDGDDSDEETNSNVVTSRERLGNQRLVRQVVNDVVYQRNGHGSEVESEDDSSEDNQDQVNAEGTSDNSDSSEGPKEKVEQKVIVLRNPSAPPLGRGVKRRRQSDSDFSLGSRDAGNRTLRTVKRMNYAPSNESDNENARPRRSQNSITKYEEGSDSLGSSMSSVNQPQTSVVSVRPQRTLNKTYKENSDDSQSEDNTNMKIGGRLTVVRSKVTARPVRTLAVNQSYVQSSEESDVEDVMMAQPPRMTVSNKRKGGRPPRASKENQKYNEHSDESLLAASSRPKQSVSSRGRLRKSVKENHKLDDPSDESEDSQADSSPSQPKISISSRGRVRKMTARARAFLRD